jgi:hypothetical protein
LFRESLERVGNLEGYKCFKLFLDTWGISRVTCVFGRVLDMLEISRVARVLGYGWESFDEVKFLKVMQAPGNFQMSWKP